MSSSAKHGVKLRGRTAFSPDVLQCFRDVVICDERGRSKQSSSVLLSIASQMLGDAVAKTFDSEKEVQIILCGYSSMAVRCLDEFIHTGCITLKGTNEDAANYAKELRDDFSDLGVKTSTDLWVIDGVKPFDEEELIERHFGQYEESDGDEKEEDFEWPSNENDDCNGEEPMDQTTDSLDEKANESSEAEPPAAKIIGTDGKFLPQAFYKYNGSDRSQCHFFCPFCDDTFQRVTDFNHHVGKFHQRYSHMFPQKFTCDACKGEFDSVGHWFSHVQNFRCSKKVSKEVLDSVIKQQIKEADMELTMFDDPMNFIRFDLEKRRQRYDCPACQMPIGDQAEWGRHIKKVHTEYIGCLRKKYKCAGCDKSFLAGFYERHKRGWGCKSPGVCEHCGKNFPSQLLLGVHIKNTHSIAPTTCEICGRGFKNDKLKIVHVRSQHSDPVPCEICGRVFKNKEDVRRHIFTMHTDDKHKPYQCSMCDRGFGRRNHWEVHERSHRNEKPYKCDFCEYSSAWPGNRISHMKQVHKDLYLAQKEEKENRTEKPEWDT